MWSTKWSTYSRAFPLTADQTISAGSQNGGCSFFLQLAISDFYSIMARQRKSRPTAEASPGHPKGRSESSRQRDKKSGANSVLILFILFGVPLCLFVSYSVWNYKRAARLYTPLDAPPVIEKSNADMKRFWGSYRSNLYFGLRYMYDSIIILPFV